jgi:hypothetical protein
MKNKIRFQKGIYFKLDKKTKFNITIDPLITIIRYKKHRRSYIDIKPITFSLGRSNYYLWFEFRIFKIGLDISYNIGDLFIIGNILNPNDNCFYKTNFIKHKIFKHKLLTIIKKGLKNDK